MKLRILWLLLAVTGLFKAAHAQETVQLWADSIINGLENQSISIVDLATNDLDSIAVIYESLDLPCDRLIALIKKGDKLQDQEKYEEALRIGNEVMNGWGTTCDSLILIDNLILIANAHLDLVDTTAAMKTVLEARHMIHQEQKFVKQLVQINILIGSCYFYKEKYDSASYYYKKALAGSLILGRKKSIYNAKFNIAIAKYSIGQFDSARFYMKDILATINESDDASKVTRIYNLLAGMETDPLQQIAYMDTIIAICQKHELNNSLSTYYQNRALAYSYLSEFEKAFDDMWSVAHYKDIAYSDERAEAMAEFQEQFESEKKARQIKELELAKLDAEVRETNLKQTRNYSLIAGVVILFLVFALLSRLRYVNRTNKIIEEEKDRSNELLLNILPSEVADELKIKGKSEAKSFDMVTILFTDFKGFTEKAEKLTAVELVDEINYCFQEFDRICEKFEIEKIKTIGDAYMAAGGLNTTTAISVKNSVLASLEMQSFIEARRIEREPKGKAAFGMRVGIHSGPVVAGIVGVKKFQYDIWGDTVNTASRMESSGEVGKVNISQATYDLLKGDPQFAFESRGKIEAKGKGEMEMWFVSKA